jgi:hypothetical protein
MDDTPLKDKNYDLISVVYHASQGLETSRQYASDAKRDGDQEAAAFFDDVYEQYAKLVTKGKDLLKQRL